MADTLKNWSGVRGLGGKALENFTGMVCVVGKISRCNSDSPLSVLSPTHMYMLAVTFLAKLSVELWVFCPVCHRTLHLAVLPQLALNVPNQTC